MFKSQVEISKIINIGLSIFLVYELENHNFFIVLKRISSIMIHH
jgi:hypothetical protein